MKYEKIKDIYSTTNYKMFKFMKGNRAISQIKLNRMIKQMKIHCPFTLIRINSKYEICDGQHTYLALKALSKPIHFYIVDNETIEDVRVINSNMKNWDSWDYVLSFADSKNENYIKLKQLKERYQQFNQNELFINLARGKYTKKSGGTKEDIVNGTFKFDNYYQVVKILDQLTDFKAIAGIDYTNYMFVKAVVYLLINKLYDHNRMLRQIHKYPHIVRRYDIDGYLEELLRKYNYRIKPLLYFHQIKN
jgi:hypothetical protein